MLVKYIILFKGISHGEVLMNLIIKNIMNKLIFILIVVVGRLLET